MQNLSESLISLGYPPLQFRPQDGSQVWKLRMIVVFTQPFLLLHCVDLFVPMTLDSAPGPLQKINDPPPYLTEGMRSFLYAFHFAAKNVNGVYGQKYLSHPIIALFSSHNSNEVWQTENAWFCLLCTIRTVFVPPFLKSLLVWRSHFMFFFH